MLKLLWQKAWTRKIEAGGIANGADFAWRKLLAGPAVALLIAAAIAGFFIRDNGAPGRTRTAIAGERGHAALGGRQTYRSLQAREGLGTAQTTSRRQRTTTPAKRPLTRLQAVIKTVEALEALEKSGKALNVTEKKHRLLALFWAIEDRESAGGLYLTGDGGRGAGWYHIHRDYWADGTEWLGVTWDYDRLVWSKFHCRAVMLAYWQRYKGTTDEMKCRQHNGGPKGHLKRATLNYWRDVRAVMERLPADNRSTPEARDDG